MYTNTFKNELTTDQKGKLLLNTCGILFYCRNGAKAYANCKGFIIMVFILFDFILNIPVNNFQLCRRIQLGLRCADPKRGLQRVLTPSLENQKPLGLFSNTGPDPLENQKLPSQQSILGNYRPASICSWADDGPLLVVF